MKYLEEVLLIIATIAMLAHQRFVGLNLGDLFIYDNYKDFIVCLSPVLFIILAIIIFCEKKNLLMFKKK